MVPPMSSECTTPPDEAMQSTRSPSGSAELTATKAVGNGPPVFCYSRRLSTCMTKKPTGGSSKQSKSRKNGFHCVTAGKAGRVGVYVHYWSGANKATNGVKGSSVEGFRTLEEALVSFASCHGCKKQDVPIFRASEGVERAVLPGATNEDESGANGTTTPCSTATVHQGPRPAESRSVRLLRLFLPGWGSPSTRS